MQKIGNLILTPIRKVHQASRSVSILGQLETSPVLISSNKDIYTNLALEHWLYSSLSFHDPKSTKCPHANQSGLLSTPIVLIWTDEPCVVIGRHQNPWIEANMGFINKVGIKLARRHSGGGCVYHDEKNINISVIGHRNHFGNRQENLRFLAKVIGEKYGIICSPNKRHDLIHDESGSKLTGSAAKLGKDNSYHHFTLLVDTDKELMWAALRQKQPDFVQTNSSTSTRSTVINLKELKADLTVEQVIGDLAYAYGSLYGQPKNANEKEKLKDERTKVEGQKDEFEKIREFQEQLVSWSWIFGMTPRFKLEKNFHLLDGGVKKHAKLRISVNRGVFETIEVEGGGREDELGDINSLIGTRYTGFGLT